MEDITDFIEEMRSCTQEVGHTVTSAAAEVLIDKYYISEDLKEAIDLIEGKHKVLSHTVGAV